MPGARCARSLACKSRKHASKSPRSRRKTPGIPRAMVLTVSFVISPVTGLFATVVRKKLSSHELDASIGASEPHDFAVCAHAVRRAPRSHPPHPASRS